MINPNKGSIETRSVSRHLKPLARSVVFPLQTKDSWVGPDSQGLSVKTLFFGPADSEYLDIRRTNQPNDGSTPKTPTSSSVRNFAVEKSRRQCETMRRCAVFLFSEASRVGITQSESGKRNVTRCKKVGQQSNILHLAAGSFCLSVSSLRGPYGARGEDCECNLYIGKCKKINK